MSEQDSEWKGLLRRLIPVRKSTPPNLSSLDENPYRDTIDPERRALEAQTTISDFLPQEYIPTGILEIGPGNGGVSRAIRTLYPDVPLLGIDNDTNPNIQEAARANHMIFFQKDVTQLSTEIMQRLLAEHTIDTIIALRTSGVVADHMIRLLSDCKFSGIFLLSLIGNTDRDKIIADVFHRWIKSKRLQGKSTRSPRLTPGEMISESFFDLHYPMTT